MSMPIVFEGVTLDGVMQAPGRADEDTRGNFQHGGWAAPYADPVLAGVAAEGTAKGADLLFGRRTCQDFASVWPSMRQPNPLTEVLNKSQKHVVSGTLRGPLPWQNPIRRGWPGRLKIPALGGLRRFRRAEGRRDRSEAEGAPASC